MTSSKFYEIQYLRAIAAVGVVGHHSFSSFGAQGVDLFFVISGFIMLLVLDNNPEKSATTFFFDRYFRIAPMYYIFTFIFILFGFNSIASPHQVIQTLTFIKYYETAPLLPVGWTLEYEFIFYSLCAFSLLIFKTFKSRVYFILTILAIAVFFIDFYIYSDKKYGHFAEFGFGALAYCLYRENLIEILSKKLAFCCILFSLSCFYVSKSIFYPDGFTYMRFIGYGLPSLLLFIATIRLKSIIPCMKSLNFLGDASYSIYITHLISIYSLCFIFNINQHDSKFFDIFTFFMAILFGCMTYHWVEKPISRKIKFIRKKA